MNNLTQAKIREEEQWVNEGRPESDGNPNSEQITISELAHGSGVTARALRFYQSKGLLSPERDGQARIFGCADRKRLILILQGKRLGFTLSEIRDMLAARGDHPGLPISRKKCVEQIKLLERQHRDIETALAELRRIYTGMFEAVLSARCA